MTKAADAVTRKEPKDTELLVLLGASSDLGGALLQRLDQHRMTVAATYHHSGAKLEAVAGRARNLRIIPLRADLSDSASVAELIAKLKADFPAPTQIVHLAAPKLRLIRFKDSAWSDF